jgi:hypothetical protein
MAKEVTYTYCLRCISLRGHLNSLNGWNRPGVLEYIYGCWWKCRTCNHWHEHTPNV